MLCESAFSYCSALEQVAIPNVLAIGDGAFYGCNSLKQIHLPASLQNLGNEVFYDCILLQTITVDPANSQYTAKDNVLFSKDMTRLYIAASMMGQAYSVPDGVKEIYPYAFRGNSQLQYVILPASVTEVPEGAFYGCTSLKTVTIGNRVQKIGAFAFYGCTALEQLQLPKGLVEIADYAFGSTGLIEITIPASVTLLGNGAFDHSQVEKVTFTGPAPQIGDDAFYNVSADVYYPSPACDPNWDNMTWDYGGYLQWYPTDSHSYRALVTPADCENGGYTTYTCGCGHSYVADQTEPAGHAWDEGTITQQPTNTTPGKRTYTCIACNKTYDEEIPPDTHEHQYTSVVTAPTCTQPGFTTYTCSTCGRSYTDTEVLATGHTMGAWQQTKAPACEIAGEETSVCSVCGHQDKRSVAALQHSYTNYVSDNNASCTADGTKTAACDHSCGKTNTVTDNGTMKPHDMGDWKTVTEPTQEQEGLKQRKCKHCDYLEGEKIPVLPAVQNITSDKYVVSGETVGNIAAGTTISQFLMQIHEAEYVQVYQNGNLVTSDALIATGMEVRLVVNGQIIKTLTAVVTGDINGDGNITLSDMLMVKSHILGKSTLSGAAALAADTNDDEALSITDFLQIKAHVLGKNQVKPHG